MAKNPQKKRVTHIYNVLDNQYNKGEIQSKDFDYVKHIMEDMDSKTIDYTPHDDPLKMELLSLTNDEHLPVQIPPASSSNVCTQAMKTAVTKFRKFSNTRKFPLMEKSQKILQQLKHNRSIPKPRAHLASIDDWPRASKSLLNNNKVSEQKKIVNKQKRSDKLNDITQVKTVTLSNKFQPVLGITDSCHKNKKLSIVKNKTKDLRQFNRNDKTNISTKISKPVLATTDSSHKSKESHIVKSKTKVCTQANIKAKTNDLTKVSKPVLVATDAICKKNELCIAKNIDNGKSLKKIPKRCEPPDKHSNTSQRVLKKCNVNNVFSNKTMQSGENSDSNTTDSEYERFIQNNKVEFEEENPKKKHPKKKKANKKKKSLSKKLQNSFPLESTDQLDSSNLDELSETDKEKELMRSFSKESLIEHYDSNCYSDSSDGEDVKKGTAKKLNKKQSITKKVVHMRKSNRLNKMQKKYSSKSSADTDDSNHFDNSSDGSKKIPNKSKRRISMESLVEQLDSNCYNDTSSDEGGEMNKPIESTTIKPSISVNSKCDNVLLRNPKIIENTSSNSQCDFNEDGNKSAYRPFKEFSSEDSPNLSVHSNLNSKLESSVDFENINCKVFLRPSSVINETSTNCTQNNSQELQNTNSNLHKSSADKCSSTSSNFDKCDKLTAENLVIDLSDCGSESKDAESSPHIAHKENFENLIRVQNIASADADSEESDIEVIEIVPAPNRNKLAATCGVSAASPDNLNRMMVVDSSTYKTLENEIKYSQSHAFENIAQKVIEPMVLDSSVSKNMNSSIEERLSEKLVKKESKIVESNNPVYMTGMCKEYNENEIISKIDSDPLGSSVFNECKRNKCKTMLCEMNAFVDEDDDIMVIEPPVNHLKQEVIDDDVIIDYVTVKKEHNPESTTMSHISSKRKNEICIGQLESDMKSDCPTSCKVPKFSNIVDSTSVKKELPMIDCSFTESLLKQKIFNDPLTNSKVLPLLELYKKELIMYQEIVRTEENVEAGLKMVEAHQAEKLMCIRSLIQNLVKHHPHYDKIYSEPVKTQKQDSLQSSGQLNSFQNSTAAKLESSSSKFSCETPHRNSQYSSEGSSSKLTASLRSVHIKAEKELSISSVNPVSVDVCHSAKLQSSSSKFSCETPHGSNQDSSEGSSSKLTVTLPSMHIKTEKEELSISRADPVSVDVCHSVARIKTEPGTSKITESSLSSDVPEDKQALKLLGKKCDVCGKDAIAACQRCAKVFFCSNKCGEKFWNDGHKRVCDKYV